MNRIHDNAGPPDLNLPEERIQALLNTYRLHRPLELDPSCCQACLSYGFPCEHRLSSWEILNRASRAPVL